MEESKSWTIKAIEAEYTEIFEDDFVIEFGGGTLGTSWGVMCPKIMKDVILLKKVMRLFARLSNGAWNYEK